MARYLCAGTVLDYWEGTREGNGDWVALKVRPKVQK